MNTEYTTQSLELLYSFSYTEIFSCNNTIIAYATASYIPIDEFKKVFEKVGELVKEHGFKKLVFDKRNLQIFHQPSMEWYFVSWKEDLYNYGLTQHRKILPKDPVFRECVKLGREKINQLYPNAKFHEMDIKYSLNLNDAIKN